MNPLHAVERNRVGRPLVKPGLKVKQHSIWLHRPVVDRIIALVGTHGLSGFMRDAADLSSSLATLNYNQHGHDIAVKDCDGLEGPPYLGELLWQGNIGCWRVHAVRMANDPFPHCVAHHQSTGIAHAERIEGASPARLKAWVAGLTDAVAK